MNSKKRFPLLKTLIIAALALSAGYIGFIVPRRAESVIPTAEAAAAELSDYSPTVSAKGALIRQGNLWLAVVAVSEADISEVEIGQRAELSGAALPDGVYKGTVSAVADTAYTLQSAGTPEIVVDVTVTVEEGDVSLLRSGYSVTAQLVTGEEREVIMLPYSVICQDDEGEYVYVLDNGSAARRNIVTGIELSDRTEIISGLSGKDLVLSNPEEIEDGERVKIVNKK